MKRIYTSAVSTTAGFLPNIATLNFLQDAYKEQLNNLVKALVPNPLADTVYVLQGCENTGTGLNYILSEGILYYNGEIYYTPASTFTCGVTELPYASIHEDYTYTDTNGVSADPSTLTDGTVLNMHVTRTIVISNGTGSGLPEWNQFRGVGSQWLPYEVKQIDVNLYTDLTFLSDNFDNTGKGKNKYRGWAICNGNNGTKNRKGRVAIGYDETNYPTLGAIGGSETHKITPSESPAILNTTKPYQTGSTTNDYLSPATSNTAMSIMQPYIVTLFIQKIY
jgi:hypothetical protein